MREFLRKHIVIIMLLGSIILLILLFLIVKLILPYVGNPTAGQENLYWLFSSSAQTIAAFVAFLITGYTLVHMIMDSLEAKDESLEDIHFNIKKNYYSRLRFLSILTGLTIVLSLIMVFINGIDFQLKLFLMVITSILNGLAIIVGIVFVISIIDPNKYKKAAKKLIHDKEDSGYKPTGTLVNNSEFFQRFVGLEKILRDYISKHDIPVKTKIPKDFPSFHEMVNALFYNEKLDKQLYNDLNDINKLRNYVFHGHIENIDLGVLEKLNSVIDKVKNIVNNAPSDNDEPDFR